MNNINNLDASWIKTAVKRGHGISVEREGEKIYLGGKRNFFKRKYNKITHEEYQESKLIPLNMRGARGKHRGNRKATLINPFTFVFKPKKGIEYIIDLKLSKNQREMLEIICKECNEGVNYFNFEIDKEYVYISFNEPTIIKEEKINSKKNRALGIDLNPNYIGLSIIDYKKGDVKDIYKEIIDLTKLNKTNKSTKKRYELTRITSHIIKLCKSHHVSVVGIEDLNIESSNKKKGKNFNRLVNNTWIRNYFINNLKKWMNIRGIKHKMVVPHYSSFIGQMKFHKDYDSVAASKEVATRALVIKDLDLDKFEDKIKSKNLQWQHIEEFLDSNVTTPWKDMSQSVNFKDLYMHCKEKKSKTSYRFLFNDVEKQKWSSFRLNSYKSMIDLIRF